MHPVPPHFPQLLAQQTLCSRMPLAHAGSEVGVGDGAPAPLTALPSQRARCDTSSLNMCRPSVRKGITKTGWKIRCERLSHIVALTVQRPSLQAAVLLERDGWVRPTGTTVKVHPDRSGFAQRREEVERPERGRKGVRYACLAATLKW